MGVSTEELFAMMERGELLAKDVLPKVALEFSRTARQGGALNAALETARIQQQRFVTGSQEAADIIFQGGFGEGISELFKSLTEGLSLSEDGLQGLGQLFKAFFGLVRNAAELVIPPLNLLLTVLGEFAKIMNMVWDSDLGKVLLGITAMSLALGKLKVVVMGLTKAYKMLSLSQIVAATPKKLLIAAGIAAAGEDLLKGAAGNKRTLSDKYIYNNPFAMNAISSTSMGSILPFLKDMLTVKVIEDGREVQTRKIVQSEMGSQWQKAYNSGIN